MRVHVVCCSLPSALRPSPASPTARISPCRCSQVGGVTVLPADEVCDTLFSFSLPFFFPRLALSSVCVCPHARRAFCVTLSSGSLLQRSCAAGFVFSSRHHPSPLGLPHAKVIEMHRRCLLGSTTDCCLAPFLLVVLPVFWSRGHGQSSFYSVLFKFMQAALTLRRTKKCRLVKLLLLGKLQVMLGEFGEKPR